MIPNIMPIKKITKTAKKGIHKGLVTHHQDQSMLLVNLSIKNTIKITIPKLNPPELLFFIKQI